MSDHLQLDQERLKRLAEAGGPAVGPNVDKGGVDQAGAAADGDGGRLRVSLFSPMEKAGRETQQNPIRLKNLLREARAQLGQAGAEAAKIDVLLAPAEAKLEDHDFWQHQEIGLAMFLDADGLQSFRLPLEFDELCRVGRRFHLKPLFPLVSGDGTFHILALSQKAVRLFEATRGAVREMSLHDEVPTSLADALGHELTEPQLQSHTPTADTGIFHAQGAGEDDAKPEIRKFLSMLDAAIAPLLRADGRDRPLVLATVEAMAAMFRDASDHRAIVEGVVAGNPENRSAEQLHEAAWPLVEPVFDRARHEAVERFGNSKADGSCSTDLGEVVIAARDGRVDTLFVPRGVRVWGRVHGEERRVERTDEDATGSEDLLDHAAVATLLAGGQVFAVDPDDVPDGAPLAANYRY